MKRRRITESLLVLMVLLAVPRGEGIAQSTEDTGVFVKAISAGDTEALYVRMAERLKISLLNAAHNYSRDQARYVVADFFERYQPERYDVVSVTSRLDQHFVEGHLRVANQTQKLEIYFRIDYLEDAWRLTELLIDSLREPR